MLDCRTNTLVSLVDGGSGMMWCRLRSLFGHVSASAPRVLVFLAFACLPSVAVAQVTTEAQLRAAIIAAHEGGSQDIALGANIVLTGSLPHIQTDLNIASSAPGVVRTIDANFVGRVFTIVEGTVTITDVRIVNARAIGGAGGAGTFPGGGGGGVGAAIYVGNAGVLTTTNLSIENAAAQGGAGGAFVPGVGGGGGGGLVGAGGAAAGLGGGGGGGYAGPGGQGGAGGGGGGGGGALGPWAGDAVGGAGGAGAIGGGGGGGRSFIGGAGGAGVGEGGGGEGGGGTSAGAAGGASTGGSGSSDEGGDGGASGLPGSNAADDNGAGGGGGSDAAGGTGLRRAGGGGGGADVGAANASPAQTAGGNAGSFGGGGGAGSAGIGGSGSNFGGGGGGGITGGDSPSLGGGGGGANTGGSSVFGGGGSGGTTSGTSALGGSGADDGGGGGSAVGGAIFVEEGGSLTMNDPAFTGPFAVTGGLGSGDGGDGGAQAAVMFSQGGGDRMPTTINITNALTTVTIPGFDAIGGGGQYVKTGPGTLLLADSNPNAYGGGEFVVAAGTLAAAEDEAFGLATIVGNGGALSPSGGGHSFSNPVTLLAGGLAVTGGASVALTGVVSGAGPLTAGLTAGSLALTGTNTFTGTLTVATGELVTSGGAAVGDLAPVVVNAGATWTLDTDAETIGSLAGAGNTALAAGLTLGGNGASTIYSGVLSGIGPLTKTGAGTFALSGANTYSAGTIVTGGTLAASADANLGQAGTSLTLDGAAFAPLASFTLARPIVLGAASGTIATPPATALLVTGVVSGAAVLGKTGTGTLALTATNTYSGGTEASAGVLSVSGPAPFGTGTVVFSGAGLQAAANATLSNAVVLGVATTIDTQANTLTMNGPISFSGALTKAGSGTLALTAVNSYTGATTVSAGTLAISGSTASTAVTVSGGSLTATGGNALADAAALTITTPGSAAFNTSETLGSITGTGAVTLGAGAVLTVGGASTTAYSGIIGGAGGLTKAGTGSLALSGAQTYAGATTVSGGTLSVAGSLASSPVQVAGGTLLVTGTIPASVSVSSGTLRGSGSVGGATLTGGTIQPTSIFTVNGNLNVGASASLTTAINGVDPNTGFGQVKVVGTVTLAGALSATVGGGFSPSGPFSLVIVDNDGTDAVSGTFSGLAEGASVTFGAVSFRISYVGGDGNDVALTAGGFLTYLAEGATNAFFDTRISLVNPSPTTAANATMRFLRSSGGPVEHTLTVPALGRRTVNPETDVPGMENANFSTVVESDTLLVVDRTMSWDAGGYGSHAETSSAAPSTTWYFAEGATHGNFDLFYLLQNATTTSANVEITYLLPGGPLAPRTYTVPGNSRVTIYVDQQPGLDATDVSAIIQVTNGVPISTERAMYVSNPGQPFAAGTDVAGIPAPASSWFFAEGATGGFFDFFLLLANPQSTAASVSITYVTSAGGSVTKNYTVQPNSRRTVSVEQEDPLLNNAAIAATVTSSVPILAERAIFWPAYPWYEGHASAGVTATGTRWALADGEAGGANATQTYILIANTGGSAASVRVTLLLEAGGTVQRDYTVAANSRFNVNTGVDFPTAMNQRFGAIIESLGASPQPIVVERSMYTNAGGVIWAAGTNVVATRLQ
jgi:fibronectin-binding autotransporter adhesin